MTAGTKRPVADLTFPLAFAKYATWALALSLLALASTAAAVWSILSSPNLVATAPRPPIVAGIVLAWAVVAILAALSIAASTMVQTPKEEAGDLELVSAATMGNVREVLDLVTLSPTLRSTGPSAFKSSDLWRFPVMILALGLAIWAGVAINEAFDAKATVAQAIQAARAALMPTIALIVLLGLAAWRTWTKLQALRALAAQRSQQQRD